MKRYDAVLVHVRTSSDSDFELANMAQDSSGIEEFVLSDSFRDWVLNGVGDEEWRKFLESNPDKKKELKVAREMLLSLRFISEPRPEGNKEKTLGRFRDTVSRRSFVRNFVRKSLRYAAALILVGGGTYWVSTLSPIRQAEVVVLPKIQLTKTAKAQYKTLLLPDSTIVKLNVDTKLSFSEDFNVREVTLEGEALFKVKPNKDRPFRVKTFGLETVVLGTEFNVEAREGNVSVSLFEGKVEVRDTVGINAVALEPGKRFVSGNGTFGYIDEYDYMEVFGWTNRVIKYNQEPLRNILKDLERTYDVAFKVEKSVNLDKTYSGTFELNSLNFLLEGLLYTASSKSVEFEFMSKKRVRIY
ncbi:hypothetical protein FUAX_29660 [Fulvitalea axinellae]|uniref:FecR family protein n=1 Tax=Fulvitalea axinellae TaxID=1182444 RepID=A0AAU9D7L2_9BACT|nr:hypothetical protein FUAX_29660 [Fulvitalea axinellae]